MITGAPNIGVTAFNGRTPVAPGSTLTILQTRATAPPINIVVGNNDLWLDVPKSKRVICGTANPIKAMGPQYAQVIAVKSPAQSRSSHRVNLIFTPKFAAYLSPKSNAFNGLIKIIDMTNPIETTII